MMRKSTTFAGLNPDEAVPDVSVTTNISSRPPACGPYVRFRSSAVAIDSTSDGCNFSIIDHNR